MVNKKRIPLSRCVYEYYFGELEPKSKVFFKDKNPRNTSKENIRVMTGGHKDLYRKPEYRAWVAIKRRCYNKFFLQYSGYGGRGIKVCERWLNSFESFYKDMGPRPSSKHSLDRVDNDGNYEPSNCRWATSSQQALNRRSTVWINVDGQMMSVTKAAEFYGVNRYTVYMRRRRGLSGMALFKK